MLDLRTMQLEALECIARDAPIEVTIGNICTGAERLTRDVVCSILAVDRKGLLHPIAAPSLPSSYSSALDGVRIGPSVGSCGAAAFLGKPVTVTDIENDPRWSDFRHLALPLGLRACWSSPILASDGRVTATFALYFATCRGPNDLDRAIVEACVDLCAIAFEQADRKAHIEQLAYRDPVTGLANRAFFEQHAVEVLASAVSNNSAVALQCINIDRFKSLNDTLGYRAGNVVLREVAARIGRLLNHDDLLARIGSDEFVVLQPSASIYDAQELGRQIIDVSAEPFEIEGLTVSLGLSVGAARAPENGIDLEALMKRADIALYQAKANGRSRFSLFDSDVEAKVASRWRIEQDLKRALGSEQFELHFQPIAELASGQVSGFEALLRWRRPGHGLVSPLEFLAIAEKTGMIQPIGEWVMFEACRLALKLPPSMRIAVNLSALQLLKTTFARDVARALSQSGLSPSRLELEVTESTFLLEEEIALSCLKDVRNLGVSVALDDFGTGCSSLSHLRTFPVDRIKIDRSFVECINQSPTTASIVRGVIAIARDLGVRTTAEGVETDAQLCALHDLGCDEIQGFLIGRPKPLEFYLSQIDLLRARHERTG